MGESTQKEPSLGMLRQLEIYRAGAAGELPGQPVLIEGLRRKAERALDPKAWGYLEGGAGAEETMRANGEAFRRRRIVPRMLRGVSRADTRVELFGRTLRAPILLAPIGVQSLLHADAEVASGRAAASVGIPVVLSTASSKPLEEVAAAMGDALRWFQLYWSKSPEFTTSLIRRAESAGFEALVVTLDTLQLGWRPRDLQHGYLPFFEGAGLGNYLTDPVFRSQLAKPPEDDPVAAVRHFASIFSDTTLTWESLAFLRATTRLPILLKGIVHPDDARKALANGADGLIVSNHGGRQVDGAVGALDALPAVVEAVADRVPVLFDSGIRQAADVFKALALGARACCLGRPFAYGLAVRGEDGVRDVLNNLLAELDSIFCLAGCATVAAVRRDATLEVS